MSELRRLLAVHAVTGDGHAVDRAVRRNVIHHLGEQALHHRAQAARADIALDGEVGHGLERALLEVQLHVIILEELAGEYESKIVVYKVNTEKEPDLAAAFGIRSIPSILFIPMSGKPQMLQGAMPKDAFKKAIEEYLLK